MAIDPRDVGELQKALNDAAGKASALWTTFVTFTLYLAISFGSVTHRDLFLETPVRLPLLGVDLPLTAFFTVAPVLLVIFHFYALLQMHGLSAKAMDYNSVIRSTVNFEADRQLLRQRVDSFPVAQFLAGPYAQRAGLVGAFLRFIGWVTLVLSPIAVLLLSLLVFLPHHSLAVIWVQRFCIVADLSVISFFWRHIRPREDKARLRRWLRTGLRGIVSVSVIWFAICVAVVPGEWAERHALRLIPETPLDLESHRWLTLTDLLFNADPSPWGGRVFPYLANHLVLVDQRLAGAKNTGDAAAGPILRGRDLRGAVLSRSDLSGIDFTGADLSGSWLDGTNLRNATLACVRWGERYQLGDDECTKIRYATAFRVDLTGANLVGARLDFGEFASADFRGTEISYARLHGARFEGADFTASLMKSVNAAGAIFDYALLIGVDAEAAEFIGASFVGASLHGAALNEADLDVADFRAAKLYGARLHRTPLLTADDAPPVAAAGDKLIGFSGTSFADAEVWRAHIEGSAKRVDCSGVSWSPKPLTAKQFTDLVRAVDGVPAGARRNSARERITKLDPSKNFAEGETVAFIRKAGCASHKPDDDDATLTELYLGVVCGEMVDGAPSERVAMLIQHYLDRLRDDVAPAA